MPFSTILISNLLGAIGAAVGGAIGYLLFGWIATQGFYGIMIPGGLLGFGCGLLAWHKSELRGAACGLAAVVLGLYCEWKVFPFSKDGSLDYFIKHLDDLSLLTWIMVIVGSVIAYYLARAPGRFQSAAKLD
jgi:hypothetical protein